MAEHGYSLLLYTRRQLYVMNKAVDVVPYANNLLDLVDLSVTGHCLSVRQGGRK